MALPLTSAHWGTYRVESALNKPIALRALEGDQNPSAIGDAMIDTLAGPLRIESPMIRKEFLEHGHGGNRAARGQDGYVPVDWDQALQLVAREMERVRVQHGNKSIYAGSYGWASAGRFHHAQSQLRRFMNLYGGATTSRDSYSYAAAEVILPHVVGSMSQLLLAHTSWRSIAETGSLVVCFGGLAIRNAQVNSGGTGCHSQMTDMREARQSGAEFINVSPQNADVMEDLEAHWLPIRPNTDVALMLALAHTLVTEGLHDKQFLSTHCVGFEAFLPYLTGANDNQPKNAAWAEKITDIPAEKIIALARQMASRPTLINASWSLTRQQNGEQVYWMLVALAALLGGIGQPGTGFGLGLGAVNGVGNHRAHLPWAALPTGKNQVESFIPVARISDMLLNPGKPFSYNGGSYTYPDIRLVYWAGGNPFHHHQDLNRLQQAWQQIETVIVHEPHWTPTARRADIVLPTTVGMERNDIAASPRDNFAVATHKVALPFGQAKNDHDIFAALARHLQTQNRHMGDLEKAFTEGRNEEQWLRSLYNESKKRGESLGHDLPDYDDFLEKGIINLAQPGEAAVMLEKFRDDPNAHPVETPSGRIEIFSQTVSDFALPGIPGHPKWIEPDEWLGSEDTQKFPLHLITHQPARRLHSQLDHSAHSRKGKIKDREPCLINMEDAKARGIQDHDLVRVYNARGSCISAAKLDCGLRPGVVMMATGAWYDPDYENNPDCCKHGNPNAVTADVPTSEIAQGPSALTCLVEIEKITGTIPDVSAFVPPPIDEVNRF